MSKKKLLAIAAVVVAALIAGGVIAWLSDGEKATNTITTGKVDIELVSANWDGETGKAVRPNQVLRKDPKIQNVGLSSAFVFIRVDMPLLPAGTLIHKGNQAVAADGNTALFETISSAGGAYDGANWTLVTESASNGTRSMVFAYGASSALKALEPGQTTPTAFDQVRVANVTDTAALSSVAPTFTVTAYGIQTTDLGGHDSTSPLEVWNIVSRYQASK